MDTKTMIGIAVAVVVVGGGVWYFGAHAPAGGTSESAAAGAADAGDNGSGSIASLIARGGDFECTVTTAAGQTPAASGTIDVSGNKMYGAFTTEMNGTPMHGYLVNDGTYVYSWSDMAPQGVKVAAAQGADEASAGGFDPNTNVSYSCAAWTPDPSVFVPPSDVRFMMLGS